MRLSQLVISLVGLLIGFLIVGLGVFLLMAAYVESVTLIFQKIKASGFQNLPFFGSFFLLGGLLLLFALFFLNKRQYLLFEMGGVSVDSGLIADYAYQNLKNLFPDDAVKCEVFVRRKNQLEIVADIPEPHEEEKEFTLEKIEISLSSLLKKQFQYTRPFILNLSFISKK